jgi:hypothetical protein
MMVVEEPVSLWVRQAPLVRGFLVDTAKIRQIYMFKCQDITMSNRNTENITIFFDFNCYFTVPLDKFTAFFCQQMHSFYVLIKSAFVGRKVLNLSKCTVK